MARAGHVGVTCIAILIVASRLHALGSVLHDACHAAARRKTPAWRLVEVLAGWPIASTIDAMRYHHLRHHAASGMATDPYRNPLLERTRRWRIVLTARGALLPLWWTLRATIAPFALMYPRVRNTYARAFLQDRSGADLSASREVARCAREDCWQLLGQSIILISAAVAGLPLVEYYMIPWMIAGVLNARRVIGEHAWHENFDSAPHTVLATTNDHDAGRLGNALLYPHNIGLHRAHHLYPGASFVHLPRLTAALTTAGMKPIEDRGRSPA